MHKLQCLQLAKQFLEGSFRGCLTHLGESSFWRNSFSDQLEVSYVRRLTEGALTAQNNGYQVNSHMNNLLDA